MIHPLTVIDESADIHPSVKIYQFATVCARTKIGKNSVIGTSVWIGADCVIGNSVRIQTGTFIPNGSILENRVFVGPNCTMTDDRYPFVENPNYKHEPPYLESGVSLGAATALLPGIRMGAGSSTGTGAIVTRNVAPHEHVRGEPARVKPYSKIHTETTFDVYAPTIREQVEAGEAVKIR